MPKTPVAPLEIYQIKVTLRDSKPSIWRRILVSSNANLGTLHQILQAIMEWNDYHLHAFTVGKTTYSDPAFEMDASDEKRTKLNQIVTGPKFKFTYEYDFGDSWRLELVVEKVLPFDRDQPLPRVIAAERASPLEDSGGVGGYARLVEILKNPEHQEYADMVDWILGYEEPEEEFQFDAEAYDLDAINKQLRSFRQSSN